MGSFHLLKMQNHVAVTQCLTCALFKVCVNVHLFVFFYLKVKDRQFWRNATYISPKHYT